MIHGQEVLVTICPSLAVNPLGELEITACSVFPRTAPRFPTARELEEYSTTRAWIDPPGAT